MACDLRRDGPEINASRTRRDAPVPREDRVLACDGLHDYDGPCDSGDWVRF